MSTVQNGSPRPAASLSDAEAAFRQAYPAYATTHQLDELRATEYARLDRAGHVYLDYTGGGLFADVQVRAHAELLLGNVFGNPHSSNPTSAAMTTPVEQSPAPVLPPGMYIDAERLMAYLALARPGGHNLFAYPAQSNFSGVQHDLEWITSAHARGWHVLLDAAAFAPTNQLDLGRWQPDFVTLSFYKIFGYPTGVGCLLARKDALALLHRPWFAGGTITVASVQGDSYYLHDGGEAFEDGTVNYLALPAVELGLRAIPGIGLETIHTRVMCLVVWLLGEPLPLRHSQGAPLVHVYRPLTAERRGGTATLDLYDPDGQFLD